MSGGDSIFVIISLCSCLFVLLSLGFGTYEAYRIISKTIATVTAPFTGIATAFSAQAVELGGSCSFGNNCKGYTGVGTDGVACCQGTCQHLKRDWAGVWYCPDECVGRFAGPRGSC